MTKKGKRILFVLILAAIAFSLIVIVLASPNNESETELANKVGKVHLSGPVTNALGGGFGAQGITPNLVASYLEEAERKNLAGIVFRVDTGGGSVAASQEIYRLIEDFDKTVVISIGDMSASGGYYFSAPADAIVAHRGSLTGSIGVIFQTINLEGLQEKLGIETETITAGEHKDMLSRELSEEEREKINTMIDDFYEQFIADILRGREIEEEELRAAATGELFTGKQALERNLVDYLGGMDKALEIAGKQAGIEEPSYYEFPEPSFFEQIFSASTEIPELIYQFNSSPEEMLLDRIEQGADEVFKYQVPGY